MDAVVIRTSMPSQVELSLTSLLPTLSPLPQPLTDLAASLLAQSRSHAASLKPEEEIGRTYAVCHIACERLGKKLSLEIGKSAPPCPPKVYARLKTYLGTVLRTPVQPRTPTKPQQTVSGGVGGSSREVRTRSRTTTPQSAAAVKRESIHDDVELQLTIVKRLCDLFDKPEAAPYVVKAHEQVREYVRQKQRAQKSDERPMKQQRRSTALAANDEDDTMADRYELPENPPALIVALFLTVLSRLDKRTLPVKEQLRRKSFAEREAIMYCKEHKDLEGFADEKALGRDVDDFIQRCRDEWMDLPWFADVPSRTAVPDAEDETVQGGDVDTEVAVTRSNRPAKTPLRRKEKHAKRPLGVQASIEDGVEDLGAAGILPGLGTMFQSSLDWLSDERREEYKEWKKGILREIARFDEAAAT